MRAVSPQLVPQEQPRLPLASASDELRIPEVGIRRAGCQSVSSGPLVLDGFLGEARHCWPEWSTKRFLSTRPNGNRFSHCPRHESEPSPGVTPSAWFLAVWGHLAIARSSTPMRSSRPSTTRLPFLGEIDHGLTGTRDVSTLRTALLRKGPSHVPASMCIRPGPLTRDL